jgi:hypothetical protein
MTVIAPRRPTLTLAAAVAYPLAWIAGLLIWPTNLDVTATGGDVMAAYAGHASQAISQYLLTQAVAGIALAIIVTAVAATLPSARGRIAGICGYGAAAVSLAQAVLGVRLAGWVVPSAASASAHAVFDLINRLDGVKMTLLAITVIVASTAPRTPAKPPRWLAVTGVLLAIALVITALGYLFLGAALAQAAWASLPLLLVWISGSGFVLAHQRRPSASLA